jgi:hypothetical protein
VKALISYILTILLVTVTVFAQTKIDISFSCLNGECTDQKKNEILKWLAGGFERVPPFLKKVRVDRVIWDEREIGKRPDGHADEQWNSIRIWAGTDVSIDEVIVHELAHLFDEKLNPEITQKYLALRYSTPEMSSAIEKVWQHVNELNPVRIPGNPKLKLDNKISEMLAEFRIPRRDAFDLHASQDGYEYWASSVELYYKYTKLGERSQLPKYFSKKEISFLQKLFGY